MDNIKKTELICNNAFELFPDIVLVLGSDMKVLYYNRTAAEVLMISSMEQGIDSVLLDGSFVLQKIKALKTGESLSNYEIFIKHEKINQYSYMTALAFEDPSSGEMRYLLFIKNMTEVIKEYSSQIMSNLELIDNNEMLKKSYSDIVIENRLSMLGHLSAGIAHEINNPLGYVANNFNVLADSIDFLSEYIILLKKNCPPGNKEISEFETEMRISDIFDDVANLKKETNEGINKIKQIINSLGKFSHTNILGKHEQLDINESIRNMLEITKNEYSEDIDIEFNPGGIDETYCIVSEINQALLNIFMNAVEASRKSGEKKKIEIETFMEDKRIKISVKNWGPVIREEDLNKVFNPFFTTKRAGEGKGLGLAIAHHIIADRHQGSIKASNTENGVCFIISLPLIEYIEEGV